MKLLEMERLKKEMQHTIDREKHQQQMELLKHQNKISEERLVYLKDMERKLKQITFDWKKAESSENKNELIKQLQILLFKQHHQQATEKVKKKVSSKYQELGGDIVIGKKVLLTKNHQVGEVKEIRGKKAVVQVGLMPITIDISDLVVVIEKPIEEKSRQ